MDNDLRNIRTQWNATSRKMEKLLADSQREQALRLQRRYLHWTSMQVTDWIQYVIRNHAQFHGKEERTLKVAHVTGKCIDNIDAELLNSIGIHEQLLQNVIIASIHNLIDRNGHKQMKPFHDRDSDVFEEKCMSLSQYSP